MSSTGKKTHRGKPAARVKHPLTILVVVSVVTIAGWTAYSRHHSASSASPSTGGGPTATLTFAPTTANPNNPPNDAPGGSVWISGGEFSMGSEDPRGKPHGGSSPMADARPIHRVYVDGFWMDKTDVTNE